MMDIKYVAGFIDADGSISIIKQKSKGGISPFYELQITIMNSNYEILKKIKKFFGCGHIGEKHRDPNQKRAWDWRVSCLNAEKILRALFPHLELKSCQAITGLAFQHDKTHLAAFQNNDNLKFHELNKRDKYHRLMKFLNKRGAEED